LSATSGNLRWLDGSTGCSIRHQPAAPSEGGAVIAQERVAAKAFYHMEARRVGV
jgi:hypothetical protein